MSAAPVGTDEAVEISAEPSELSTAETAECRCPDFCERDHDVD